MVGMEVVSNFHVCGEIAVWIGRDDGLDGSLFAGDKSSLLLFICV